MTTIVRKIEIVDRSKRCSAILRHFVHSVSSSSSSHGAMDGFAWCEEEMGTPGSLDIGGGLHRIDSSCRWAFAVHPMGSFHFRDEADAALFKVFFG